MTTDSPSDDAPAQLGQIDPKRVNLHTALNDWLVVLDRVLSQDLNPEQHEQLAKGASELRRIVEGMADSETPTE